MVGSKDESEVNLRTTKEKQLRVVGSHSCLCAKSDQKHVGVSFAACSGAGKPQLTL